MVNSRLAPFFQAPFFRPTNVLTPTAEGAINQGNNRLANMTYDAAGNQTDFSNTWHFTYDAENRQTAARVTVAPGTQTTFSYAYDGDGRRVKRNVPGHTDVYVYDAFGTLAAEYQDGAWLKDFVYMGGKLLMVDDAKQGPSYLTTDHLGSTRLVTNASGGVISRHDYLPFGKEVPLDFGRRREWGGYETAGPAEHVLQRFTGKELDPETGLDYFGARYYSGRQGRFTSADPENAGAMVRDPQSWNMYAYVGNNPLRFVDPFGLAYQVCDSQGNCTKKDLSDEEFDKFKNSNPSQFFSNGAVYFRSEDGSVTQIGTYKRTGDDLPERGVSVLSGLEARASASNKLIAGVAIGSAAVGALGGAIVASSGATAITGATTLGLQAGVGVEGAGAVAASSGISLNGAALQLSREATRRMAERGFSKDMVQAVVRNGTRYWDPKNGTFNYVLRGGFGSGKSALVGVNPVTNIVTTVIRGTINVGRMIPF